MVIGATFGIGKTSLAIHLTSTIALKYLEDPNDEYNYIPIFVPLKGKLTNIDEDQNSLDDKIKSIADGVEGKKKKILVICDGLDEYGEDQSKLLEFLGEKRNKDLPNIKVIITTRLEGGIPQKLDISSYVRLIPFNEDQVNQFFQRYGLSDIRFDILKSYNLTEEEIFKPLFCWMFAIMRNSKSFDTKTIFKDLYNPSMTRALIYQGFIHSIIRGKYKDIAAEEYHWTQYHLTEEKHILRKIAALRQTHYPTILTKSMVIEGLKNYGISYDEATLKDVLDPILTSYFYFQSTTARDMSMDFIHKSFREYFLAEYYLESILDGKGHYLNVGVPTPETILFLDGLLELLLNGKNENLKELVDDITKSLLADDKQRLNQIDIKNTLLRNAQRIYEEERIIFQTDDYEQKNKIWSIAEFPVSKYPELWIHRWLSLYVLNNVHQQRQINIDKKVLADFIVKTSHTVRDLPKRLSGVDLSYEFLSDTYLSNANLSYTDLYNANLYNANLSNPELSYANLSNANLRGTNLVSATLDNAILPDTHIEQSIKSPFKIRR